MSVRSVFDAGREEGLWVYLEALESSHRLLEENRLEAEASINRIVHSLLGKTGVVGWERVEEVAKAVGASSRADLAQRVTTLTDQIRRTVSATIEDRVKILLIEDSRELTTLMKTMLASPNREMMIARTGVEAERMLYQGHEVSLVVLDLVLPDMDGRSLLLRLRERPETASLPIMVLSARGDHHSKEECLALGADAYF